MHNIQKSIFKTKVISPVLIPLWIGKDPYCLQEESGYYEYDILRGTQICLGGFIDIGGQTTAVAVFANTQRTNWVEGTRLYTNSGMTIPAPNGFYKSITGGSIDKFFFNISNGVLTNYTLPNTGC